MFLPILFIINVLLLLNDEDNDIVTCISGILTAFFFFRFVCFMSLVGETTTFLYWG